MDKQEYIERFISKYTDEINKMSKGPMDKDTLNYFIVLAGVLLKNELDQLEEDLKTRDNDLKYESMDRSNGTGEN